MASKYFSPSQIESDQKDLIIAQLKAEVYELSKNEQNCSSLIQQIQTLEHKYQSIQEEKRKFDEDFRFKYEITIKEIGSLKSEVDSLQIKLKEKNMEFQELKAETANFVEINEQDAFELSKTLKEIAMIKEEHQLHSDENKKLQKFIESLQDEKKKITDELKAVSNEIDSFEDANYQLEKKLRLIEDQNKEIEIEHREVMKKNEALDLEIAKIEEESENFQRKISEGENTIKVMVRDINDLDKLGTKMKGDLTQVQKHIQNQIKKTETISESIKSYESTFRNKDLQIKELKAENSKFRQNNIEISDINLRLSKDLEVFKRNIEIIQHQNSEIINEINSLKKQDERIKSQLNRKTRFFELKEGPKKTYK